MGRSQAFTLTMLATSHLRQGDLDHGIQVGQQALRAASAMKSKRVIDRLKPLEIEAVRQSTNPDSRELADLARQYLR
jgi:hypothetical protein